LQAEVFDGGDDAVTEELSPEAVHGDAGSQGMSSINEPSRQRESIGRRVVWQRRQETRDARRHLVTERVTKLEGKDW